MTPDDPRFGHAFDRLMVQSGRPVSIVMRNAYGQALRVYPIEAVERAADELSRAMGRWMPTSGQWAALCDDLDTGDDRARLDEIDQGRVRPGLRLLTSGEASRMHARDACVAVLEQDGETGIARFLAGQEIHPVRVPFCQTCGDRGTVSRPDPREETAQTVLAACACRAKNPIVRERREVAERIASRRRRETVRAG